MSGFVSDPHLQSVPAIAGRNPQEGDLCLVRVQLVRIGLGFLQHFCFWSNQTIRFHFFISTFCRISRSSGIVTCFVKENHLESELDKQ